MGNKVSSLHQASVSGDYKRVRRCLEDGADPKDPHIAPVHAAAMFGHLDVLNALLDTGAPIDEVRPLDDALFPGYVKMCHPFPSNTCFTPLGCAILGNEFESVLALLKRGASPNGAGESIHPLTLAIRSKASREIVTALVHAGARSLEIDFAHTALMDTNVEAAQVLWEAQLMTDPTIALDELIDRGIREHPFLDIDETVAWLLDHGADVRQLSNIMNRLVMLNSKKTFELVTAAFKKLL